MRLAVSALALALAPSALGAGQLELPYHFFRLPNGLAVIVHEDHSAPIVSVNTWYHVGSGREVPGRTGFAHLFEHLMFEGSRNVPEGAFDRWLEAVGGDNNGSTTEDRTNYFEDAPSNALEVPLFLESDRMGFLLDTMTAERVDGQRDVVKNERRQSYENRPYGKVWDVLPPALFPHGHPYSWPIIGSMADLSAASRDDVADFFRRWYGPANASVVIAGDVDAKRAHELALKWFGEIPASAPLPPLAAEVPVLEKEKRIVLEDDVQLPRLYVAWPTPPIFSPADAALEAVGSILATGKNSRLYRRLVYELQVAQDVAAGSDARVAGSAFMITVTAREGHTLEKMRALVDEEVARLGSEPPTERELQRFVNRTEASFFDRLEHVGGFGGKANLLNSYYFHTGNPDYLEEDLARYRSLSPRDVQAAVERHLGSGRVVISVVPKGQAALAVAEVR